MYLTGDESEAEFKRIQQFVINNTKSKREKEIANIIDELYDERESIKQNKTLVCTHCEKRTQIKKLTIVSAYHYIRPYSCSGGDYWTFSNEYYVICPKCDSAVRSHMGSYDKSQLFDILSDDDQERIKRYIFLSHYYKYFGEHLKMYENNGIASIDLDKLRAEKKKKEETNFY